MSPESVDALVIRHLALDVERATPSPGHPCAAEVTVAVVLQGDSPPVTVSVLIDLVLGLEPAIVPLDLVLPIGSPAAVTPSDDLAVPASPGRDRRSGQHPK